VQQQQQGPSEEEIAAMQEDREMAKAKQMAAIGKLQLNNAEKAHKMMVEGIGVAPEQLDGFNPAPDEDMEEDTGFYE
jgi:hypothetical protein